MAFEPHRSGFVLVSTMHGTLIVNRFDQQYDAQAKQIYGMGHTLLEQGAISLGDINLMVKILHERRKHFGEQVMVLDCGANIGTHTVSLANAMTSWGRVVAFEPQERVFYALAGNVALNNCFNAQVFCMAVGAKHGEIKVPNLNYLVPSSYGSLELRESQHNEQIGQEVDYRNSNTVKVIALDGIGLKRVDLIKIDVEGMEMEVLEGAKITIEKFHPVLFIEHIKIHQNDLVDLLDSHGYSSVPVGMNTLAIHSQDPCHELIVNAVRDK